MHPDRHVRLESSFNFRDLGGYRTRDGRRVRWRQLYRADGLGRLTEPDMEVVRQLGLATVIDLRSSWELEARGIFPLTGIKVDYHHLPMLEQVPDRERFPENAPVGFMAGMYFEMVERGAPAIRRAIGILSRSWSYPAVFHCSAGKDRTGILAALVLGTLGVLAEDIVSDYALSQTAMQEMKRSLASESPESARVLAELPGSVFTAEPAGMEGFLQNVAEAHGSVEELVRSLGVSDAEVHALRDCLLD